MHSKPKQEQTNKTTSKHSPKLRKPFGFRDYLRYKVCSRWKNVDVTFIRSRRHGLVFAAAAHHERRLVLDLLVERKEKAVTAAAAAVLVLRLRRDVRVGHGGQLVRARADHPVVDSFRNAGQRRMTRRSSCRL